MPWVDKILYRVCSPTRVGCVRSALCKSITLSSEMGLPIGRVIILTSEEKLLIGMKVALKLLLWCYLLTLVISISRTVTISLLKITKGVATMILQ